MRQLVLASSSPRRCELLKQLGRPFRVVEPLADETLPAGLAAHRAAEELAHRKAESVAATLRKGLVLAADTHIHADHVTALGTLREQTGCASAMGAMTRAECVSVHFHEREKLRVDKLQLDILYTPGHTDDSYSFVLPDRVFTGDTLLIRGTGRTDFQNGDPGAQYDSLFNKLL